MVLTATGDLVSGEVITGSRRSATLNDALDVLRIIMSARILIVEDHEHLRNILALVLMNFGYQPILAENGAQAIEQVISTHPDLVLLDLNLPDMTGLHVAHAILTNPISAQIPIVGCSAYSAREVKAKALRAGMVAYLQKPLRASEIHATIERFICHGNNK